MQDVQSRIQADVEDILHSWEANGYLRTSDLLVVGTSTSEILGEHIGSAGSEDVAAILFEALRCFRERTRVRLVFQCCEHLNRALVLERETLRSVNQPLEEVSVVPAPEAGGSMATYAYKHFDDAVVVETVKADAGIDIGDTLIGMHLKRVAVPVRLGKSTIGNAHVTVARTRPKLIGGERAHYWG